MFLINVMYVLCYSMGSVSPLTVGCRRKERLGLSAPCLQPRRSIRLRAMSRELADGLAATAMTVGMEVSIHATADSFALSRQRARRPPRLEREFTSEGLP